ncbi:MotA/TolQ/ExbB proton channel family protein [Vibrio genomosp. F10]|uniref:Biopolymer transporter ExbB n=1 Tax=Vibrio genomosp. F10 TaxID=723171 RepID=A0A1B9R3M2_9VIBR|nr:MotA/TolQ/ExbB proton channel family protein [Vibrio genomosp. F10]OCH78674.1 biopolymer transporter ExbB [Vibrio genomosp. F10]OEE96363.1 biopolymer transporter ExbB [Vibrio genomosp. F10 str. 9ZD137]
MHILNSIHSQLGMMTWPLTIMSMIVVMILLERSVFLLLNTRTHSKSLLCSLRQLDMNDAQKVDAFSQTLTAKKHTLEQGAGMLLGHRYFTKSLREEAVSIWLQKKRHSYTSGLKVLSIIGVIAPLVGLLGTVLGLIEMFKTLGDFQGSIEPSLLAKGLGLAMSTTAAGLLIALPAIIAAQLFHLWADNTLNKIEHGLNHCNLLLEGVYFEVDKKGMQKECGAGSTQQSSVSSCLSSDSASEDRSAPASCTEQAPEKNGKQAA